MQNTIPTKKKQSELLNKVLDFDRYINPVTPAIIGNGIRKLGSVQRLRFLSKFKESARNKSFTSFIPASGSGSRMFKVLLEFVENYNLAKETVSAYINKTGAFELHEIFSNLKNFPFYFLIHDDVIKINESFSSVDERRINIAKCIVSEYKLQKLPKALHYFHCYNDVPIICLEEHISSNEELLTKFKKSHIHFTVDTSQAIRFQRVIKNLGTHKFNIDVSFQNPDARSFCLDKYNNLLKNEKQEYVTMPAGHGVLLSNLNTIKTDYIHIHNIDNLPNKKFQKELTKNRKILLGYLLYVEKRIFKYLAILEQDKMNKKKTASLAKFLKKYLHIDLTAYLKNTDKGFRRSIYCLLNKPLRVGGMILNSGSPGGGPYWTNNEEGISTLQIIEKVELDMTFSQTTNVVNASTHFNPVELMCTTKDYRGNKFDLFEHRDATSKMVVQKSYQGSEITFLEEPGLWNGGMRYWNTMFIQIDAKLFNPVKSITDLLSRGHQN